MNLQRTLKKTLILEGIGVHSGKLTRLKVFPALPNYGIVFVRSDLKNSPEIYGHFKNIISTQMATTLGKGSSIISTVEHLMAAFYGLGIDNARIEVDGPEIPILDGSSKVFFEAMKEIGTEAQLQPRTFLRLKKKIELRVGEKWAVLEPARQLKISSSVDWDHPMIGYQEFTYEEGKTSFEELVSSRTFGFLKDVEALKKQGLARGGSLDNAVVLDEVQVLNPDGLRSPDEFVKHKILDALGDFMLAGVRIQASIRLHRSGHDLHNQILQKIFKDETCFELLEQSSHQKELAYSSSSNATPVNARNLTAGFQS